MDPTPVEVMRSCVKEQAREKIKKRVSAGGGDDGSYEEDWRDEHLEETHVSGEGRLVTHSRGDTTEQGRHFGTGLRETTAAKNIDALQ